MVNCTHPTFVLKYCIPPVHSPHRLVIQGKKNGTFVNKYAWNGICKQDTFQEVSFQLKNWKVYFFFHLCVRECMVCFPIIWLICWLERIYVWVNTTFWSIPRRPKKSFYLLFPHSLFEKWKSLYSKVCTMESSWKWDFPTFQAFISIQISLCQKTWSFTPHLS